MQLGTLHPAYRLKILALLGQSSCAAWLDSGTASSDPYGRFAWLAAAGSPVASGSIPELGTSWERGDWTIALLPYTLNADLFPRLPEPKAAVVGWPAVPAFRPDWLIYQLHGSQAVMLLAHDPDAIRAQLAATPPLEPREVQRLAFRPDLTDADFREAVAHIRERIRQGEVYQVNLSRGFTAEGVPASAEALLARQLDQLDVPFGAMFRWQDRWLVSGSMERFLARRGQTLITQPIKGTRPRGATPAADAALVAALAASAKDRAENVMIVDMARNDLHRSCLAGSVEVPERFGVHTYPHVHQLISTVTGRLRPEVSGWQAMAHAFPPASMTGAPKEAAMQVIHDLEPTGRGAYAGALGWIDPQGDFDFSVLIRAIYADESAARTHYRVGGGITWGSDPATELAETEWKAQAIRRLLGIA